MVIHMNVDEDVEGLLEFSRETSWNFFGRNIIFYVPSLVNYKVSYFQSTPTDFPAISVTGTFCSLKCKHCEGKVLETMMPATSPGELINVCRDLKEQGCRGCLISGGCAPNRSLPIERFFEAISYIKRELKLTIVMHTGLVDSLRAKMLKRAGVDVVVVDVIGSDKILREVYGLDVKVKDYENSLKNLCNSGIKVVPHVTVGLYYGRLEGETRSLKIISTHNPRAVVITALMPLAGTPMENVKPPTPEEIAKVLVTARFMMPRVPIVLGCARPSGEHRVKTDILALKVGVNAIAFPTEEAIRFAESMGLSFLFSPTCCSLACNDVIPPKEVL